MVGQMKQANDDLADAKKLLDTHSQAIMRPLLISFAGIPFDSLLACLHLASHEKGENDEQNSGRSLW